MLDLVRRRDWERRFTETVADWRGRDFAWAEADCCRWAAACVEAITGTDPMAPERKRYTTRIGALRLMKEKPVAARWDERFPRVPAARTQRGDIVLHDGYVGVVLAPFARALFIADGLVPVDAPYWERCWAVAHG